MVGTYEPYVDLCRRLDELWPGEAETKSILLNSGAEAIENAVKIARAATGRAGVVVFDRAFHGRTSLTMAMTAKLVYKQGFGPLATDVYRVAAPYPFRGISTEDALASLDLLFRQDVDPSSVACIVLEPVQGEGGFIPMPAGVRAGAAPDLRRARDRLRRRRGAGRLRPHRNRVGDRAARSRAGPARQREDARRRAPARRGDRPRRADGRGPRRRARRHVRRQSRSPARPRSPCSTS